MKVKMLLLPLAVIVFSSCLGISMDITIRENGSGKIALEYRVSQTLESLGRLDGNERSPAVPVGKADFERTIARIPGLRLSRYSSKDTPNAQGGNDLVTKVTLDFKDTAALLAFLDSAGEHASLIEDTQNAGKLLRLIVLDPPDDTSNPDLLSLLREVSSGYELSLSFSLPKNASIAMIPPSVPAAKLVSSGKKVSFSIDMGELLGLKKGLALEIRW